MGREFRLRTDDESTIGEGCKIKIYRGIGKYQNAYIGSIFLDWEYNKESGYGLIIRIPKEYQDRIRVMKK